jgi:NAD(P)H-hydrate epimerase
MQLEIIRHLPVSVVFAGTHSNYIDWYSCQVVIDAIWGYGLNRQPQGAAAEIIKQINLLECPVVSLDTPSGLHTTDGAISDLVVKADATLTLALPKIGLLKNEVAEYVGNLFIADISVPPVLYRQIGLTVENIFDKNPIILYRSSGKQKKFADFNHYKDLD